MLQLENKGELFVVRFDGYDYNVPAGIFEVEETLGNHILMTSNKWKKEVAVLGGKTPPKGQGVENRPAQPRSIGGPATSTNMPGTMPNLVDEPKSTAKRRAILKPVKETENADATEKTK